MTSQQLEPTEDDFGFVPDNRPVHDDHDPAVEALEEKYWAIVSKFEGYGYGAKIVEPHDEWLHIAVRVPDDGRYPGPEVHHWAAHVYDYHGGAEALITIDSDSKPVVSQIAPNPWPEYWAVGTFPDPEPNESTARTALKIAERAINPPPAPDYTQPPSVNPFAPHKAGGLLEAIAGWVSLTNRRPSPEFAMLAAIGFVSALFSRRAVGPTHAGLNMYLAGLATTGFGKEHPLAALQCLAYDCKMPWLIGPGDITSGAAIEKIVRRRPAFIMPMDELGALLESVNGRGAATWAKTIRKVLLELYSKSTGSWTGREYADPDKDSSADPIFAPTVSFMGMSTPETFYAGLTEESLSDGFLNRLTIVSASERPKKQEAGPLAAPASLIEMVKDYAKALPQSDLAAAGSRTANMRPSMVTVPWADESVREHWDAIEDWQVSQITDHGRLEGVMGRFALQVLKLATVRALSMSPAEPQVTMSDVEWGRAIVWKSVTYIEQGIETHMAGSAFEELVNAILNALRASPTGYLSMAVLVKKKGVSKADHKMVKAALDRLFERGDIYMPSIVGTGMRVTLAGREVPDE